MNTPSSSVSKGSDPLSSADVLPAGSPEVSAKSGPVVSGVPAPAVCACPHVTAAWPWGLVCPVHGPKSPAPAPSAANGDGGTFTGTGTLDTSGIAEKRMPLAAPAPTTLTREEVENLAYSMTVVDQSINVGKLLRNDAALRARVEALHNEAHELSEKLIAARDRVSELERVIEEAPHSDACGSVLNDNPPFYPCSCFKSEAKEPKR